MQVLDKSRAHDGCAREGDVRLEQATISAWMCLSRVARDGPEAGAPLIRWLWSRRWSRALRPELREDVLQAIGLTLLQRARAIVAALRARTPELGPGERADRIVTAYVRQMVHHRAVDALRGPAYVSLDDVELAERPALEPYLDLQVAVALVERAWKRARDASPRMRGSLRELRALALAETTMNEVVAAHAPSARGGAWIRMRDRLYKRHYRAREAVVGQLRSMQSTGEASAERVENAIRWMEAVVLRRQSGGGESGHRRT